MDEQNNFSRDPWERDSYETGSTRPPKSRTGLIAGLFIAVILLCSVSGAMGILNIKLFSQLQEQNPDGSHLAFHDGTVPTSRLPGTQDATVPNPTTQQEPSATLPAGNTSVVLRPSPEGTQNIPQEGGLSLQEIYENTIDSVVSISCRADDGSSSGTGVVLSRNGYLVTNSHVVEDADRISVLFTDGRQLEARVVGADAISDLAVLWVDAKNLEPAQFGSSDSLRVGDLAVAIGDPLGIEFRGTMTDGIISAINRDVTSGGRTMTLIQTNAALNSGNSGGPLLNCYGQVIGINTLKIGAFTDSAGVEGIGFAIPSTTVKEIVDQLIAQGYVSGRPYLGLSVREISSAERQFYRLPAGLLVTQVEKGTNAHTQGLEAGDILVQMDGSDIATQEALTSVLLKHQVGDSLNAVIYRGGKYYTTQLTLEESKGR